jgi:hypothetical protein
MVGLLNGGEKWFILDLFSCLCYGLSTVKMNPDVEILAGVLF